MSPFEENHPHKCQGFISSNMDLTSVGRGSRALDPGKVVEGAGAGGGTPGFNTFAVILHHLQAQ